MLFIDKLSLLMILFVQPFFSDGQELSLKKEKQFALPASNKEIIVENFNVNKEDFLKKLIPQNTATASDFVPDVSLGDSLKVLLRDSGKLKIGLDSIYLLNHLVLEENKIQYLANIVFSVKRLGATKSLNYAVKKGDTIRFSYTILKGAGLDELEVLEGKELRYGFSKSKKNVEQNGEFVASADEIVVFNLTNKGINSSKGKLLITRKEMQQKLSFVFSCDTLDHIVKEIKQLQDTVTEILVKKTFSTPSKTDITQSNRVQLNIPVPPNKTPIAIAYWFGTKEQNRLQWNVLSEADKEHSPLEAYVTREISRDGTLNLPEEQGSEIDISLKDKEGLSLRLSNGAVKKTNYATPTLNKKWNYACFSIQKNIFFPETFILEVQNNSTLYNTITEFEMIGLFLNEYQAEIETKITTCKEYVTIKTL